ncbi:hypothetical protein X777_11448, partial [Ooceraea biroi]
ETGVHVLARVFVTELMAGSGSTRDRISGGWRAKGVWFIGDYGGDIGTYAFCLTVRERERDERAECDNLSWYKTVKTSECGTRTIKKEKSERERWTTGPSEEERKDANIGDGCAGAGVYGAGWQCLAWVDRWRVTTATDNAGPADDTPGNVTQERTQ